MSYQNQINMESISMNTHDFHKQNLVTEKGGYDMYKCNSCGCEGKRNGLNDTILVTDAMGAKAAKCTFKPESIIEKRPKLVLTVRVPVEGGVDEGLHEVVDCPDEYKDKYLNDVWVLSNKGVPVRIMPREIIDREF